MPFLFYLYKGFSLITGCILGNLWLRIWGCSTQSMVKCFGIPRIERSSKGTICLGGNVLLRSSKCSNIAGIWHPVLLGTIGTGQITIGNGCGISGSTIVAGEKITLEDDVWLGVNCQIYDCDFHSIDFKCRIKGERGNCAPVIIRQGAWLGANVIVLKGVEIGARTVVGAGSVVTKSLPPNVLAAGNPARVIRELD